MNLSTLNNVLFFISTSFPIIICLFYATMVIYYGSIRKKTVFGVKEIDEYPSITILIPSYNEEKIILKRLENILKYEYPKEKLRVIFIDESTDSTPEIIKQYSIKHPQIELIQSEERLGYSAAVVKGLKIVTSDYVVLNDAGSFPLPDTLIKQVSILQDPQVGVVTGHPIFLNKHEEGGKLDSLYIQIINYLREAESQMDSTPIIKGEVTAYLTELVKNIEPELIAGSMDTTLALYARKKGYRVIYSPDIVFEEYSASDDQGFRKQKMIRAANIMRNLILYKEMILNTKYGKFGTITMPFYFSAFFIIPLLIPASIISITIGLIIEYYIYQYIALFFIVIIIGVFLLSRNLFKLFLELELSILKALYEIYIQKIGHDKMERVESTRRAKE